MKAGKTRESYLKPEPKEQPNGDPLYPRVVRRTVEGAEQVFTVQTEVEHLALDSADHDAVHGVNVAVASQHKQYPCGCEAFSLSPDPLPDYCPTHRSPQSSLPTTNSDPVETTDATPATAAAVTEAQ